jgi:glutamate-1-semialdehyde 2,1-aminomutase
MKRFREERPADICFARGTFNSHPYVMGAMQVFLERLHSAPVQALYADLDARWDAAPGTQPGLLRGRPAGAGGQPEQHLDRELHAALALQLDAAVLPAPHGLALSWVGTGRLVFSLNYSEADFDAVCERFVAAALAMQRRWLVVAGPAQQQVHPPRPAARDAAQRF